MARTRATFSKTWTALAAVVIPLAGCGEFVYPSLGWDWEPPQEPVFDTHWVQVDSPWLRGRGGVRWEDRIYGNVEESQFTMTTHEATPVAYSDDGRSVAIGEGWQTVYVTEVSPGTYEVHDPSGATTTVTMGPDGPNVGNSPSSSPTDDQSFEVPSFSSDDVASVQQGLWGGGGIEAFVIGAVVLSGVTCGIIKHAACAEHGGPDWGTGLLFNPDPNEWFYCTQDCRDGYHPTL